MVASWHLRAVSQHQRSPSTLATAATSVTATSVAASSVAATAVANTAVANTALAADCAAAVSTTTQLASPLTAPVHSATRLSASTLPRPIATTAIPAAALPVHATTLHAAPIAAIPSVHAAVLHAAVFRLPQGAAQLGGLQRGKHFWVRRAKDVGEQRLPRDLSLQQKVSPLRVEQQSGRRVRLRASAFANAALSIVAIAVNPSTLAGRATTADMQSLLREEDALLAEAVLLDRLRGLHQVPGDGAVDDAA